jgi:hypothetical protein
MTYEIKTPNDAWTVSTKREPLTLRYHGQSWEAEGCRAVSAKGHEFLLVEFDPMFWNFRKRPPFNHRRYVVADTRGKVIASDRDQAGALAKAA